jgi:hypothetical protein
MRKDKPGTQRQREVVRVAKDYSGSHYAPPQPLGGAFGGRGVIFGSARAQRGSERVETRREAKNGYSQGIAAWTAAKICTFFHNLCISMEITPV